MATKPFVSADSSKKRIPICPMRMISFFIVIVFCFLVERRARRHAGLLQLADHQCGVLRNNYTFVALKLAWGEARGRECIPSDTRPTEQRSTRPISAQPEGRHVFWAEALLLAPYRSTAGYARRSRLASAQNPLPRMYSYFGDTTLATASRMGGIRRRLCHVLANRSG